ncbi:restriction endonuclease subunit S [Streptococcus loxodontisalivarius]|uniref:Restriction endonuclease S subunit n=1 Tax=Streptococcus loxodontisalivarius TaxID=1349415 RepID=A0ABS2PPL1_9STRE|nr:restriction endonuclease subunit S [Streptococcus loxodontisalivarius]MBM7641831.1 restriction endonuclease S subunit [Streptococcus loxodontisalivarius]
MDLISQYQERNINRLPLGDLVTAFKGKAVPAKAEAGDVAVVNLSDMTENGILYDQLKTFSDQEHKLLRYLLKDGDVLIASKGTVKKIAVFEGQERDVVASSNITVLRPGDQIRGYFIKFFLDTDLGQALLDQADKGKAVLNLSTKEILDIEIPVVPLVKQDYQIANYLRGKADYDRKLARAKQEWEMTQDKVLQTLFR